MRRPREAAALMATATLVGRRSLEKQRPKGRCCYDGRRSGLLAAARSTRTTTQGLPFVAEAAAERPLLGVLERQPKGRCLLQKQQPTWPLLGVVERQPLGRRLSCSGYWYGNPRVTVFCSSSGQKAAAWSTPKGETGLLRLISKQGQNSKFNRKL
jgi:hypothetical protein